MDTRLAARLVGLVGVSSLLIGCGHGGHHSQQPKVLQYEMREESTAITNLAVVSPENLYVVNGPSYSADGLLVYSGKQWVDGRLPNSVSVWRSPTIGGAATKLVPAGEDETLLQGRSAPTATNVYFTLNCSVYSTSKNGVGGRRKYPGTGYCDYAPVPFPDERKILFSSCVAGRDCFWQDSNYIWVMNPDGTNMTQLRQGVAPTLSPDGGLVAFSYGGSIWTMRIDGTEATNISASDRFLDNAPAFSGDGKRIFFARRTKERNSTNDIWMMAVNGIDQVQLTMNPADDWAPYVAPDGLVYFVSNRGALVNQQNPERIWRMQLAGEPAPAAAPAAAVAPPPPPPTAAPGKPVQGGQCTRDTDCKGDRVCDKGRCVSP